jgi:hypothetical protein
VCALEEWTAQRRRWLRPTAAIALIAQAIILLPLVLPVLPASTMATTQLPVLRKDFADTVGWHELVGQVAQIYNSLSPEDRSHATILTNNYGEAGAINTYGPALGLPRAVTGQLSYYYWKPASLAGPVIAVGMDPGYLETFFDSCPQVGTITNPYGLQNEEFGRPLAICRGPKYPLDVIWVELKAFR